jgi:hypothetical protein
MPKSTNVASVDKVIAQVKRSVSKQIDLAKGVQPVVFGAITIDTAAADRYLLPYTVEVGISALEKAIIVYRDGELLPFVVPVTSVGNAAAPRLVQIVVRKNGVDTPMAVQFTCPQFTGILRATVTLPVLKDDRLSVVVRKSGALTADVNLGPLYAEIVK